MMAETEVAESDQWVSLLVETDADWSAPFNNFFVSDVSVKSGVNIPVTSRIFRAIAQEQYSVVDLNLLQVQRLHILLVRR